MEVNWFTASMSGRPDPLVTPDSVEMVKSNETFGVTPVQPVFPGSPTGEVKLSMADKLGQHYPIVTPDRAVLVKPINKVGVTLVPGIAFICQDVL